MKLSTNFLKEYVDVDVDTKTLAEAMTKAGSEYDSAENLVEATNSVTSVSSNCSANFTIKSCISMTNKYLINK